MDDNPYADGWLCQDLEIKLTWWLSSRPGASKHLKRRTTMPNLPGFGDEATWPEYSGHPNDPRRVADYEEYDGMTIADVIDYLKQFDGDTRVVLTTDDIPTCSADPNKHPQRDWGAYISLDTLPLEN